jgi:thioredoxin 1
MLQLNDANYQFNLNAGVVLIDFMADWCQPCKAVSEHFKVLEPKYPKVKFAKVNVDTAPKLAGQMQVNSIPTVLLVLDGVPTTMLTGSRCTLGNIKELLDVV